MSMWYGFILSVLLRNRPVGLWLIPPGTHLDASKTLTGNNCRLCFESGGSLVVTETQDIWDDMMALINDGNMAQLGSIVVISCLRSKLCYVDFRSSLRAAATLKLNPYDTA